MRKASPQLDGFIDELIRRSAAAGYHPTTFMSMRQRHGTIDAISRLVQSGDVQSGFKKLKELGLIDFSIEGAIQKFPNEFSKTDRECATFRLRLVNTEEA